MKSFVIDIAKCNGCYNCQIACKDEHVGNDWAPYAKPQPDTGQFWIKLNEKVRGTVPKVKVSYVPTSCMHCRQAPCITSCSLGAIYRRDDGLVLIDPAKCTGCMSCVHACSYGAIYFNRDMNLAQKCTGCAHLLDRGWKVPRCVEACPTAAIRFGEEEELKSFIKDSEVLLSEKGTRPLVHYLNLPKRFIAGSVFDSEADECLEDVKLTLIPVEAPTYTGEKSGICEVEYCFRAPAVEKPRMCEAYCFRGHYSSKKKNASLTSTTDAFGDFWFNQIDLALYTLKIEKEGYVTHTIEPIDVYQEDVNLGDIGLQRKR